MTLFPFSPLLRVACGGAATALLFALTANAALAAPDIVTQNLTGSGSFTTGSTITFTGNVVNQGTAMDDTNAYRLKEIGGETSTATDYESVAVSGNYAYVTKNNTLRTYDISNPAAPTLVSSYIYANPGTMWSIKISGNYAYVAFANSPSFSALLIFNIASTPSTPFLVSATSLDALNLSAPQDVVVNGTTAYLVSAISVSSFNISNPAAPTYITKNASLSGSGRSIAISSDGQYLYVGEDASNGGWFDVLNAATLAKVGSVDLTMSSGKNDQILAIAVSGTYAYATMNDANGNTDPLLRVVNVSNPAAPAQVATRYLVSSTGLTSGTAQSATLYSKSLVVGNLLYANDSYGVAVFDVSSPASPVAVGLNWWGVTRGYGAGLFVSGNSVYETMNVNSASDTKFRILQPHTYARFCIDNASCLTSTTGQAGSDYDAGLLTAGSSSPTVSVTWSASAGSHTVYFCGDVKDANGLDGVAESNETNNCTSSAFTVSGSGPNLIAGATAPSTAVTGTPVGFSSTVSNTGTLATGSSTPSVFQIGSGGPYIAASTIPILSAGASAPTTASYTFSTAGTYQVRACSNMDTTGAFKGTETNYGDDCGAWTSVTVTAPPLPDLTVLSSPALAPTTASVSAPVQVQVSVKNQGTAATGASFTNLLQKANDGSGTGASDIGTQTMTALSSGSSNTTSISYTFPSSDAGTTKYLRVCADKSSSSDTGVITESDETNNCGPWSAVSVTSANTAVSCSPSSQSITSGGTANWTSSVSGSAGAPYTWYDALNTVLGTNSTLSKTYASAGNYAVHVAANNGAGSTVTSTDCLLTVSGNTCSGATTPTISATPTRVVANSTVTISWSATGVAAGTTCTLSGPNIGGAGVNSKTTAASDTSCNIATATAVPTVTGQSVYTITCGSATDTVVVDVVPQFTEF